MKRSSYCGCVKETNIGEEITVCGWVHSHRNHGGVIFIDLRDREGILQIIFQPEKKNIFKSAENLHNEYVISVKGLVKKRPKGTLNSNIATGNVELVATELEILNTSSHLPFEISNYTDTCEELRLKYRYLDLRRPQFQKNFITRHKISQEIRKFFNENGFLEIETPFLTNSTPEGARDFLIPSRLNHGSFFALPQSPQLFKQILMVSGFDKYYQFAKCFRDEDLRADRQLEFTQIDIEMSFVNEDDIMNITEKMLVKVFKKILNIDINTPFERISYTNAILNYGSDKPDTRFEMKIKDFSKELKNSKFTIFSSIINRGGVVRGLCIPKCAVYSHTEINELTKFACKYGANGLAWMKITNTGAKSNIVKYFKEEELKKIIHKFNAKSGDLIIFIADEEKIVIQCLGALRLKIGKENNLIDKNKFNFLWVVDFPLMEWNEEENKWQSLHHPFTAPKNEDFITKENIKTAKARAYDIILNGTELGGGSIRIHKNIIQKKIFDILNVSEKYSIKKFEFLLNALTYGAPPHGGLALGFDRLCTLILKENSIREVIAFPKTQKTIDPLSNAPTSVSDKQIKELGIYISNLKSNDGLKKIT
ncbi:MAG: aspartate--tRNA ligase [Endomicrobium sp.]|jgi:aspartyl-tRNA synthetase|nr:aspartate--tRNA ligase [Endomicrobium sp.]